MAEEFDFSLFGDVVVRPSTGETADPIEVLADKVILLYFGALWNEPSVKFNLKLGLFDSLAKVPEEYEIVFCSMDRSEEDYNNFCAKMSGWCLPYAMPTLPKLITEYKAHGMPHLVVIDKDGSLITMEGVQSMMTDPVGKNFPWRRIRVVDILPETYVIKKDGEEVKQPMSYLDDRHLMLYFAARSDDLSKEFTPWMTKAYNILKGKRGDDFELLYVSGDESEPAFEAFFGEMTCGAIDFDDSDAREALETRLDITAYPTLVMLGPKPEDEEDNFGDRPIINSEVRAVIENGDYITDFPFYPKPYGDLCKTTDDINTHKCLIVFHEQGDEEEQFEIEYAVRDASEEYRGEEFIKFYWAFDQDAGMAANIWQACELIDSGTPTMVLLDVKNDGAFYVSDETEITPETIKFFLMNFKSSPQGTI
mmetsp:Transcript_1018/g.1974  ORF Transcript_1018/g.1974 Transcript_1018/m.1974 type:complete len:422 (-) Transcript_1018:110-1375(-)|eukprot:CAMPEP_0113617936 /NCGR_PEP_ID=MMETSP0017_2-20120614/9064_1 /TAXON_ID=2856 /ORGANISM="Cylindrotheca closterium" /LENGTH=421 /DNA_ID=CAMNT_0000527401 /DNA_START=55 /DNA_END=1320 /DNA_ORIENTATION=- /assembly_acc=CAM_ASM_000147